HLDGVVSEAQSHQLDAERAALAAAVGPAFRLHGSLAAASLEGDDHPAMTSRRHARVGDGEPVVRGERIALGDVGREHDTAREVAAVRLATPVKLDDDLAPVLQRDRRYGAGAEELDRVVAGVARVGPQAQAVDRTERSGRGVWARRATTDRI